MVFLENTVGDEPCDFYLGGFGVYDRFATRCCLKYKATHPNVKLIQVVAHPFKVFNAYGCDEKVYLPLKDIPPYLIFRYRNAWMVDKADYVILRATFYCGWALEAFNAAKSKNKKIFNIATNKLE